ncbi:penicillin acylase family protein [Nocardioides sp. T2.26MG-1]|uniref:penicillin acylase family protein n=1 Tax=Nocardioides sp. T2.26MG-1 TaxID=3041166 RepID=UPI0024778785|nr:penicillin acylase family protein [Nocardioides sp. T2.26MG-1]CAI9399119.1 Acyl-homoserine lactone acylase QuiP [Nocardioides sp. T2.26MG-1]
MPATTTDDAPGGWWRRFRAWPRLARVATYVVLALVLVLLAGLVTVVQLVRTPFPQTTGAADLPGLEGPVEVIRDDHGIPQLYGDSVEDLMRAQGYVQAQERFFEMDVRRHQTAGRLAELFGASAVDSDAYARTLGWRRVAEQELALVRPETRAALEAYADGVNAYLDTHAPRQVAVEYTVLNAHGLHYRPEEWTPADSLAWLKAMAWDLRGNMTDEIDRALALAGHTRAEVADLYPAYPTGQHPPIVDQGAVVDGVFEQDATMPATRNPRRPAYLQRAGGGAPATLTRLRAALDRMPVLLGRGDGLGSNGWVVSGDHTTTGGPVLADDPHLGTSLPGVWMQMGLHCRTVTPDCPLDVAGFTLPGVPGVVIGHNADIAWGFANLGADTSDLYLERVEGDQWRYDRRWRPLGTRTETIRVHGGDDVTITVRATAHGPLLSDVDEELAGLGHDPHGVRDGDYAVAVESTALHPTTTADAILALDTATDWTSVRSAAASLEAPAQSLLYADRAGHIGYQATGRIPIRRSGNDGLVPAAGWRPENDWTGQDVPFDGLPRLLDPDSGVIVAANQQVVGEDYTYPLGVDWDLGYRAQRIRDLLQPQVDAGSVSVDTTTQLQLDDLNPLGPVLTPYLLDVDLPRGYYSAGQRLLRSWDFRQQADSGAAAYFDVVWRELLADLFHDDLPEAAWPDGGDRWVAVVTDLLDRPSDPWWDDKRTEGVEETRDDILARALRDARAELTRRQALDPADWTWGHLHRLALHGPARTGPWPLRSLADRGGWDVGGGSAAVDATAWDAAKGYAVTSAPSMRMVVSLADLDESRWISLTGVSGHPFNAHYTDQTDLWADGKTLPWVFSRAAVDDAGEDVLTLQPPQAD